jgi:hypothetical protein
MDRPRPQRIHRQFTPEERARWLKAREELAQELPELIEKGRRLKEAQDEPTLSGALRRWVHRRGKPLTVTAREAGMTLEQLDAFLLGELNLRSDVLDRLARAVEFQYAEVPVVLPQLRSGPSTQSQSVTET